MTSEGPLDRQDVPATREPASLVALDRAIGEWRRGRPVAILGPAGQASLARTVEGLSESEARALASSAGGPVALAVTARRAMALGLPAPSARVVVLEAPTGLTADAVAQLADPLNDGDASAASDLKGRDARPFDAFSAAVELSKVARLLPAAAIVEIKVPDADDLEAWARRRDLLVIDAGDIFRHGVAEARTLVEVNAARVPLLDSQETVIHTFRPADGGAEHLAMVIGRPEAGAPVLTRVHSECFTGDLLGSLRCDCGDQLRGAIREIADAGAGILLYLAQEGRGIGLVNKLRAYELQDQGFDTLDANEQLGFEADERIFLPAAQMLRLLGFRQVRLMTNNPEKVAALAQGGIEVTERVAHSFPSNEHNESYLRTKQARSGHLF